MGTFFPNRNDDEEDDPMMICDPSSSNEAPGPSSCFRRSHSGGLGNDYCPHSSQLFPLMEANGDLPLEQSSLRKQTAVTCLAALAETPDYEGGGSNSSNSHPSGGVFGGLLLVAPDHPNEDDEWGQFAHHEAQVSRSGGRRVRIPSRRKPHQRRRSPAKYGRHGSSSTNAWRG